MHTCSKFGAYDNWGRLRTPYAINCDTHDLVYLTNREYDYQMGDPDRGWRCPECGDYADWDDDNYEEWHEGKN